jgi:hypothetical protein
MLKGNFVAETEASETIQEICFANPKQVLKYLDQIPRLKCHIIISLLVIPKQKWETLATELE